MKRGAGCFAIVILFACVAVYEKACGGRVAPAIPAVPEPQSVPLQSLTSPSVDASFRRVGGQGMLDFIVADKALSKDRAALESRMRHFCDVERPGPAWCQVMVWIKSSMVPKKIPMTEQQANAQFAVYTRNPHTGYDCFMLMRKGYGYWQSGSCQ